MLKLKENKLLIITVICVLFQILVLSNLIGSIFHFMTNININLGDHWIYEIAIQRYWENINPFQEYFVYLPSFFLLSYLVYPILVYFILLITCSLISLFILFKLDNNKLMNLSLFFISLLTIMSGNIDVFIFLIILICLWNQKLSPFLLAFITFKPTVILVLPYFLYRSEKRFKFIFYYCLTFILTNYYFILNPNAIWLYYDYTFNTFNMGFAFLRPYWISYVYYFFFMSKKVVLKEAKQQEKILKEKLYLIQNRQALKDSILKKTS